MLLDCEYFSVLFLVWNGKFCLLENNIYAVGSQFHSPFTSKFVSHGLLFFPLLSLLFFFLLEITSFNFLVQSSVGMPVCNLFEQMFGKMKGFILFSPSSGSDSIVVITFGN